ncbi:ubiquitin activating enzyme e1-like protein, partial [Thalassiosira pseudonana CCMP1335]
LVRFQPFRSVTEPSFWLDHSARKLNELRLSEEGVPLWGFFGVTAAATTTANNASLGMRFDVSDPSVRRNESIRTYGHLFSLNTKESLRTIDKNKVLSDANLPSLLACCGVEDTDEDIDPNIALVPSTCIAYCDLKANAVVYWFAFPALAPKPGCGCRKLSKSFHKFRVLQEEESVKAESVVWCPPFFMLLRGDEVDGNSMQCLPLNKTQYESLTDEEREKAIFGFVDPNSTSNDIATTDFAVGWTLRNLVAYLSLRFGLGGSNATFLSYRPSLLRRIVSLLLDIKLPHATDYQWPSNDTTTNDNHSAYKCAGWEPNKSGKAGARSINLKPLVSPSHLARQANDLNLRLMKWRALPALDIERLSQLKVVLLGAGTLGCGVARTLLGWGIRNITFVDSGRVSYSNPVRQSLFGIDDCKEGGKYKAKAAAESLLAIAGPGVNSEGVVLTIPMPCHSFGGGKDGAAEIKSVRQDVERLHALIDQSDAVFLLTDTRESRWLPTVMALATNTPLINSALGLDSWLVMRHGSLSTTTSSNNTHQRLGCYFCSDVVAPENSTRDRTLDQQCTVTRPGLAPIAASMATELMIAMFHHPLGHYINGSGAYAPVDSGTSASSSALGLLPHSIRGTVVTYTMMTPTVPAFPSCTACSELVVKQYQKDRFDFVKSVCCDADGSYLGRVSGLASFREEAAKKIDDCMDWDDEDEMD